VKKTDRKEGGSPETGRAQKTHQQEVSCSVSEDDISQIEVPPERKELQEVAAEEIAAELQEVAAEELAAELQEIAAEQIAQATAEERGEVENAVQHEEPPVGQAELQAVALEEIAQADIEQSKIENEASSQVQMPDRQAERQLEQLQPQFEQAKPRTIASERVGQSKPRARCLGGKRVAENNREGIFDSFSRINESVFSFDGIKKAAAWYIETSEKLANQAIELQKGDRMGQRYPIRATLRGSKHLCAQVCRALGQRSADALADSELSSLHFVRRQARGVRRSSAPFYYLPARTPSPNFLELRERA
jgi:hypothetical protein